MPYPKEGAASIACMSILQEHELLCPSTCKIITESPGDIQVWKESILSAFNPTQHNLF